MDDGTNELTRGAIIFSAAETGNARISFSANSSWGGASNVKWPSAGDLTGSSETAKAYGAYYDGDNLTATSETLDTSEITESMGGWGENYSKALQSTNMHNYTKNYT